MKRLFFSLSFLFTIVLLIAGCSKKSDTHVVEVTAKDYSFHSKDTIPSGWTTFRFNNEGHAHHFFFLTLLPEKVTFHDYINDLSPAFDTVWDSLQSGMDKAQAGALLGKLVPAWSANAKVMGGAGIIAPGKSEVTTIKLVPGNYVMECYIKTEDGRFHGNLGMIKPIFVTEENSVTEVPSDVNYDITLSSNNIETNGNMSQGLNTVAVHFKEQPQFGPGNDIHVVRLLNDTNLDTVINWMDWMNINGMRTPSPAVFYGGTQDMPAGYTSYFTVDLDPGRYAFISETARDRSMVREFTVQ